MTPTTAGMEGNGLALCPEQQRLVEDRPSMATWGEATREVVVDIRGELDLPRLHRALGSLPDLHPIVRARLRRVEGFHGFRLFPGSVADGVLLPEADSRLLTPAVAKERLDAWRARPFDVCGESLLECLLLRLGDDHWHLVLACARILLDGAGMRLLAEGLTALYESSDVSASVESASFEQYLEWRAEVAVDEDAQSGERYWQDHLRQTDGELAKLPYRLDAEGGGAAVRVRTVLDAELVQNLLHMAGRLSLAPDELLQAAWWALLGRVTGQSNLMVGWRHDSRKDYEYFSSCAGLFEKSLPLHLSVTEDKPFDAWAAELREILASHATWQEYWAPQVGQESPAYGYASVQHTADLASGQARWGIDCLPERRPSFELLLQARWTKEGVLHDLVLDYLPERYASESIARLIEQYLALLQDIAGDAKTPLGRLNLTSDREVERLLAFNPASDDLPQEEPLLRRVQRWMEERPRYDAIVDAGQRLTYGELGERVRTLAARLADEGIGEGSVVAIALPRSAELLVSILATWWVGAAYLPLDPRWPHARQALLAEQAGVKLILGRESPAEAFAPGITVIYPAAIDGGVGESQRMPYPLQGPEAAYLLFTSGSTGVPKGVIIEHRHLANYVAGASQALELWRCSHFAFTSSVAADLGNTTLFGALYNGACLHVADDEVLHSPERFSAYLEGTGCDCLKIVPSHLSVLLDTEFSRLPMTVVLGGEPTPPVLVERIFQVRPDCRLFNHYGPTEATVGVMVQALTPESAREDVVPLGQVLPGNQVYVLDANGTLAPLGVLGELFIGGRQLCRGYLAHTEGQAFVDSPFTTGERLYRTGDLARYRADGSLSLHGRRDQQVKINGFRVELGEIEAELLRLHQVKEAAVLLSGVDGQMEPTAFVVPFAHQIDLAQALRDALGIRLPMAMLPRQIHVVEQLPRLHNGKIDRRSLAALVSSEPSKDDEPPRDALEQLLSKRMAQLLGRESLGRQQDFFSVGGHSLLVIKLVAAIRKFLQIEASPAIVFDHPTVTGLAGALRKLPGADQDRLEALSRAYLQLEALPAEERARLEEKARKRREVGS